MILYVNDCAAPNKIRVTRNNRLDNKSTNFISGDCLFDPRAPIGENSILIPCGILLKGTLYTPLREYLIYIP